MVAIVANYESDGEIEWEPLNNMYITALVFHRGSLNELQKQCLSAQWLE